MRKRDYGDYLQDIMDSINAVEEFAEKHSFALDQKMVKPIKGIQNTMRDEYILFLRKV